MLNVAHESLECRSVCVLAAEPFIYMRLDRGSPNVETLMEHYIDDHESTRPYLDKILANRQPMARSIRAASGGA